MPSVQLEEVGEVHLRRAREGAAGPKAMIERDGDSGRSK